jgi:4-hydroxy-3-polyprenylbenzoate decarboxylase
MSSTGSVTVAWTGASGLVYGVRLVEVLLQAGCQVNLTTSSAVKTTAPVELGKPLSDVIASLDTSTDRLKIYGEKDFASPLASGSALGGGMVVCPCSMGTAARIAAGTSETLLLRAADVCLKERRPLILVPREAPLATHHLENLARLSARGALILPAAPGFYHRPRQVSDLVDFIVQRICDHLDVAVDLTARWDGPPSSPEADLANTDDTIAGDPS